MRGTLGDCRMTASDTPPCRREGIGLEPLEIPGDVFWLVALLEQLDAHELDRILRFLALAGNDPKSSPRHDATTAARDQGGRWNSRRSEELSLILG
jgi:hypothetical protein